jgi:hypothetical protein
VCKGGIGLASLGQPQDARDIHVVVNRAVGWYLLHHIAYKEKRLVLGRMPLGTSAALPIGGLELGDFAVTPVLPAQECSGEKVQEVRGELDAEATEVTIGCNLTLDSDDVVIKRLILEGKAASGITVDGDGATLNSDAGTIKAGTDMIEVRSRQDTDTDGYPAWEQPEDVRGGDRPAV